MPPTILLFGATGDLARRMLLPSLYELHADGLLPAGTGIVATARCPARSSAQGRFSTRRSSTRRSVPAHGSSSPGLIDRLARAAIERGVPFLPGIATAADIVRGLDLGLDRFKFFQAVASGGLPALTALAASFGDARFCPTGGITAATAPD